MGIMKCIKVTLRGYDMKTSDSLRFYKHDNIEIVIDVSSSGYKMVKEDGETLSAIVRIVNPSGDGNYVIGNVDLEQALIRFRLKDNETELIGDYKLQVSVRSNDEEQFTLPPLLYEVRDLINSSAILVDEDGNPIVTAGGGVIVSGGENYKVVSKLPMESLTSDINIISEVEGNLVRVGGSEVLDLVARVYADLIKKGVLSVDDVSDYLQERVILLTEGGED